MWQLSVCLLMSHAVLLWLQICILFRKTKIPQLLGPSSTEGNSLTTWLWGVHMPFKGLAPLGFKVWFFHLLGPWAKCVPSWGLSPPLWNMDQNDTHFVKSKTVISNTHHSLPHHRENRAGDYTDTLLILRCSLMISEIKMETKYVLELVDLVK